MWCCRNKAVRTRGQRLDVEATAKTGERDQ